MVQRRIAPAGKKWCPGHQDFIEIKYFPPDLSTKDGLYGYCIEHKKSHRRKLYKDNPEKALQHQRKHNYGITSEQYQELYKLQGGVCAACGCPETRTYEGRVRNLAVDHCHITDAVRSLLCHDCNTALGLLKDDPERIEALLRYAKSIK